MYDKRFDAYGASPKRIAPFLELVLGKHMENFRVIRGNRSENWFWREREGLERGLLTLVLLLGGIGKESLKRMIKLY